MAKTTHLNVANSKALEFRGRMGDLWESQGERKYSWLPWKDYKVQLQDWIYILQKLCITSVMSSFFFFLFDFARLKIAAQSRGERRHQADQTQGGVTRSD